MKSYDLCLVVDLDGVGQAPELPQHFVLVVQHCPGKELASIPIQARCAVPQVALEPSEHLEYGPFAWLYGPCGLRRAHASLVLDLDNFAEWHDALDVQVTSSSATPPTRHWQTGSFRLLLLSWVIEIPPLVSSTSGAEQHIGFASKVSDHAPG